MQFEEFMHQRVKKIPGVDCNRPLRIGVVGYSDNRKVDTLLKSREWVQHNLAWALSNIREQLQYIHGQCDQFELVSGLTNMGVPGIAYHFVTQGKVNQAMYVKTVGFACSKAKDYPQFPVDEKHIIGDEWGDESSAFLSYVDALIRIGDGGQSIKECNEFKQSYPNKPIEELGDALISQWVE